MKPKYDLVLIDVFAEDSVSRSHGYCSLKIIQNQKHYKIKKIDISSKNNKKRTHNHILISELRNLTDTETKLICIPLSSKINNENLFLELYKLKNHGINIIAPYMNGFEGESFPASYSIVQGIKGINFGDDRLFKEIGEVMYFNDTPTVFKKNGEYTFFSGNSKACSLATRYFIDKEYPNSNLQNYNLYTSEDVNQIVNTKKTIEILEEVTNKKIIFTQNMIHDVPIYHENIGINEGNIKELLNIIWSLNTKTRNNGYLSLDHVSTVGKLSQFIGD
ncbi:hypothetical protein [Macrococcoides caseolyticum]|uniref:hypothetical protein n=1 Tax=Macrococcoides caseolyticum TaxID=69966 RepID=UPI001F1BE979|nr:hypothetical protein [Macrococcus caseolyticus]MCE4957819.1 hypothetical protein [Macrococcus caseolyticus]